LREGIINQFKKEFAKLKVELSVRLLFSRKSVC
jgi:hypothetical protein